MARQRPRRVGFCPGSPRRAIPQRNDSTASDRPDPRNGLAACLSRDVPSTRDCLPRTHASRSTSWHPSSAVPEMVPDTGRRRGARRRVVSLSRYQQTYDPGMSDRKTRLTVTVDPHLAAYAEQLVNAGKAPSVSAVFNDALAERVERDKRIRRRWKEAAERADPEKVDRMIAHVQSQAAVLPGR